MSSVLSYIIQKRMSQEYENVATDALAYILRSDAPLRGMMRLLRGIAPNLPPLRFETQETETETGIRPDMWGYAGNEPRVFVENKFWAGLTEKQPVEYLRRLAEHVQPSILLVVVPASREQPLRRVLSLRLSDAGISSTDRDAAAGTAWMVSTGTGPVLALTSWTSVLSILEHECAEDPRCRGDLVQLRELCDAADIDAFGGFSASEISDQRTPASILQLSSIVDEAVEIAVTEKILKKGRLQRDASAHRIGQYALVSAGAGPGAWIGVDFQLWKTHGMTPLWLTFSGSDWGQASRIRPRIESWAANSGKLAVIHDGNLSIALAVPPADDRATVVRALLHEFRAIGAVLAEP